MLLAEGLEILLSGLSKGRIQRFGCRLVPCFHFVLPLCCFGGGGFFWHRQTRLCQMPRAHCTCSRVVDPERVAGLGLGPSSELGAIYSWRLDLWPRWAASTAEMRIWHMAGLQDCSLFTALSACKYRSRVGLSVVQLGGCVLFRTVNITQLCLHNAIM